MTMEYHNPELHKHLKAATKESSDLLKSLAYKLQFVKPTKENSAWKLKQGIQEELESIVEGIIPNEPCFKSCVAYLVTDVEIITETIEEVVREILQMLTKNAEVEISEENVRKIVQEWVVQDVDMDESVEEGTVGSMHRWVKDQVNSKTNGKVLRHIGEYLNCPDLNKWDDFREFNEQTFDEYYIGYEKFLYSNLPLKYQIVASLENFNYPLPSPDIILSGNTRIVSNRDKHIDGIMHSTSTYDIVDPIDPDDLENATEQWHHKAQILSNFWLEIDCEIEKGKIPSECKEYIEHTSLEEVKRVFQILRLYKQGDFRHGVIYWRPNSSYEAPYDKKLDFCDIELYDTPNKYLLQKDDVNELQLLYLKCTKNKNKKAFPHSSIYYLDKGICDTDIHDRLVDYTAALESLFADGTEGIASQLALRTAFFLEEDRQKRKEIFKDIKKAYGFRSNIVHGNYHKIKDELDLDEYCNKTERYVRLAIIKWIGLIDKGMKQQDIYDLIDENLFT